METCPLFIGVSPPLPLHMREREEMMPCWRLKRESSPLLSLFPFDSPSCPLSYDWLMQVQQLAYSIPVTLNFFYRAQDQSSRSWLHPNSSMWGLGLSAVGRFWNSGALVVSARISIGKRVIRAICAGRVWMWPKPLHASGEDGVNSAEEVGWWSIISCWRWNFLSTCCALVLYQDPQNCKEGSYCTLLLSVDP